MAAELHSHLEKAAGHGDVLKHVILMSHIQEQQKAHPEGIVFVDTHCGPYVEYLRGQSQVTKYVFCSHQSLEFPMNRQGSL